MSVKKPGRKNTVWDMEIERTSEWQSPIATDCAAFDEHKQILLDKLSNGYKLGLKSHPFEANQSWRDLTSLARLYFSERKIKQEQTGTADCIKRLRQLETALRHARNLVDRAMRDDVGADLFCAWLDVEKITKDTSIHHLEVDNEKTSSILIRAADRMKEAAIGVATLETAARKAVLATDVLSKEGRSAMLPRYCIQGLARVYRKNTGTKPGRGDGPFAEFAYAFMKAVGQTGEYRSLIDAIQDAHRLSKPSWFDEKI